MIDFNNASFIKLRPTDDSTYIKYISPIFVEDETIIGSFKGIRDGVVLYQQANYCN